MITLQSAIAECLELHARAVEQFGTETPEELNGISEALRRKMRQARANVSATLSGSSPEQHVLHLQSLCRGLRLVMKTLYTPPSDQAGRSQLAPVSESSPGPGRSG